MKRFILILLISLFLVGCIKGNVSVEKNETKNESIGSNVTINESDTEENKTLENTPEAKPKERFLPWQTNFKDLKSFYASYYYVKSGYIDAIAKYGSLELIPEQPSSSIIKIWFMDDKLRIDRYDEDYQGKGLCEGSPTEFLNYDNKSYALTGREIYSKKSARLWRHTVISQSITEGSKEKWKCEMKLSEDPNKDIKKPTDAIDVAYNLYANKYAKPNAYASEDGYDKEVEQTKNNYDEYYARDGARYVRETNALKRTEKFADREVVKFYVAKDFGGYGYEMRDVELGLGLAFYMEKLETDSREIRLGQPLLVYKILELDKNVDDTVFDLN